MGLDPKLKDLLVCPKCHGELQEQDDPHELVCRQCRLAYPVRDDLPVMLIEEARSTAAEDD